MPSWPVAARSLAPLLASSIFLASATTARGADKAACVSDAEEGQRLHKQHKLVEARDYFLSCAASDCPDVVFQDCTRWLGEVDRSLASVVVRSQDSSGQPVSEVRVLIDGVVITEMATSTPIAVNPGRHLVRYERHGLPVTEEQIDLGEGERGHVLFVQFPSARAKVPEPAPSEGGIPAWTWVFGGVAVVAVGSFVTFGLWGTNQQDTLMHSCAPYCGSQVDSVKAKFIIADVSLGVGVAAIGAAAVIAFTHARGTRTGQASQSVSIDATGLHW